MDIEVIQKALGKDRAYAERGEYDTRNLHADRRAHKVTNQAPSPLTGEGKGEGENETLELPIALW